MSIAHINTFIQFTIKTTIILSVFQLHSAQARPEHPRIHNYAKTFLLFWDKHKDQPVSTQIEAFKREVVPIFPAAYEYKFASWRKLGLDPDSMLAKQLQEFPKIAPAFAKKTFEISQEIENSLKSFHEAFDDFHPDFDIYIVHSLGELDGGIRTLNGKPTFIFGIDGIVKYHSPGFDMEFYHHELFHYYHLQHFSGPHALWSAVWAEGLATFVSQALNPGATFSDIGLDIPEGLVKRCNRDFAYLKSHLINKLDSVSEVDYATFFLFSSRDPRVPKRAGYYFGFLVAKHLSMTRPLKELAKLRGGHLRKEIQSTLESLTTRTETLIPHFP